LFQTAKAINEIKTPEYKKILETLGPKIDKFALDYGTNDFDKFCKYAFKTSFNSNSKKELGKIYHAVIICFKKETKKYIMSTFKKLIQKHYSYSIFNFPESKYANLQKIDLNQNINIQYFEHNINIEKMTKLFKDKKSLDLPNYWTSLTKEGIVMNNENSHIAKSVVFSFPYYQMIACSGFHPESMKIDLKPEISKFSKPNECCISYFVDNISYCKSVMFCSNNPEKWKCKVEIKILRASLYERCMEDHVNRLNKDLTTYKSNIQNMGNIGFLEKARHIFTLKEIINGNFNQGGNQETQLGKIIDSIRRFAKNSLKEFKNLVEPQCITSYKIKKVEKININELSK